MMDEKESEEEVTEGEMEEEEEERNGVSMTMGWLGRVNPRVTWDLLLYAPPLLLLSSSSLSPSGLRKELQPPPSLSPSAASLHFLSL